MRSAALRIVLLTIFFLVLCACQVDSRRNDRPEQDRPVEVQQFIQAYSSIIIDSDMEGAVFSLIYLDNDTIPELVVLDRSCASAYYQMDQHSEKGFKTIVARSLNWTVHIYSSIFPRYQVRDSGNKHFCTGCADCRHLGLCPFMQVGRP